MAYHYLLGLLESLTLLIGLFFRWLRTHVLYQVLLWECPEVDVVNHTVLYFNLCQFEPILERDAVAGQLVDFIEVYELN